MASPDSNLGSLRASAVVDVCSIAQNGPAQGLDGNPLRSEADFQAYAAKYREFLAQRGGQ